MKQITIILTILFLYSCSADPVDSVPQESDFWNQSDSERMGMKGMVDKFTEYNEIDSESYFSFECKFDNRGNVTAYNTYEVYEGQSISPYWLPQNMMNYEYEYANGKLSEIRIISWGSAPVTYTLHYDGSINRYILLDLPLKPFSPVLIKGVSGITSSDNSFLMEWVNDELHVTNQTEYSKSLSTYLYKGESKPQSGLVSLFQPGAFDPFQTVESAYTYHSNGAFKSVRTLTTEDGGDTSSNLCEYDAKGYITLSETTGSNPSVLTYKYNTSSYLLSVKNTDKSGDFIGDMSVIYDYDPSKNWIRTEKTVNGFIDWETREGKYILIRTITYK
ncbi:MAG: hypothetical protein ACRCX4_10470 [Bacteroidales bacterium]